jgi:hypothetical protein
MGGHCLVKAIRLTIKVGIVHDRDDAARVSRSTVQTGAAAVAWFHVKGGMPGIRAECRASGVSGTRDTFCRFA